MTIAKDWGGKPFVDMANGWKQALKAHPEVLILFYSMYDATAHLFLPD